MQLGGKKIILNQNFYLDSIKRYLRHKATSSILITVIFFIVSFIGIQHHEIWMDEAQAWLLSRDSANLSALFSNIHIEGHPITWYLLLYVISKFSLDPFFMQLSHIGLSTLAAFLFIRYSPFNFNIKILFLLGYYVFYEYNLISRNYILCLLFLYVFLIVYSRNKDNLILHAILLGFLANSHLIGMILAGILFLVLVLWNNLKKSFFSFETRKLLLPTLIFAILVIIPLHQMSGAVISNVNFHSQLEFSFQALSRGAIVVYKGLFPFPNIKDFHFWNTNYLISMMKPLAGTIGMLSILIPLFVIKKKEGLLIFYINAFLTSVFIFITQMSATRYVGMIFFGLVASLWIDDSNEEPHKSQLQENPYFRPILSKFFIYLILLVQASAGVVAWVSDYRYPFSQAKACNNYINSKNLGKLPVVSHYCAGTALSAYLQKKVYYTSINAYGSFCDWSYPYDHPCCNYEQLTSVLESVLAKSDSTLLIFHEPIADSLKSKFLNGRTQNTNFRLTHLQNFTGSVIRNENFYAYLAFRRPN